MISSEAASWSSLLLTQTLAVALRASALAAATGMGLAAFRVKATSVRLFTWTAVLYAIVVISLLGWMLPPLSVPVPALHLNANTKELVPAETFKALPPVAEKAPMANQQLHQGAKLTGEIGQDTQSTAAPQHPRIPTSRSFLSSIPWSVAVGAIYLMVAALLVVRIAVGLFLTSRLTQASQRILEPRIRERISSVAAAWTVAAVPRVAESELISVPVTVGALRSTILLPAGWREWDDAKLDTVIAHEISHVIRHDALTQFVSLLHRAIFWFSPLAWWLDRHLNELAEQASDEAALSAGVNRNEYARILLGFFETQSATPQRVWWQGVSMANAGQAEQRVEKILAWRGAVTMGLKKSVAVMVITLAIPLVYLAASVRPTNYSQGMMRAQEPAPPAEPSATPAAPLPASAPVLAPPRTSVPAGVSAVIPVEPVSPLAPLAPPIAPVQTGTSHGRGYSYSYGYDDEQRFVIVSGKTDAFTMSGSSEDARHVEKLRKQISGDFIWFQRDEKSYIIRDQATVDRARKLWAPQEELGRRQEELGKQQEALGKQQEELGAKMERIQVKVPDMTAELDKLRTELKALSSGATAEQVGKIQSEIGELQSKIGEVQSRAGDQQSKLGEEMGALGEKQGKLGEQQGELGRQQGELAQQATHQMKELLDEAIKKGTAQPEPQAGGSGTL